MAHDVKRATLNGVFVSPEPFKIPPAIIDKAVNGCSIAATIKQYVPNFITSDSFDVIKRFIYFPGITRNCTEHNDIVSIPRRRETEAYSLAPL